MPLVSLKQVVHGTWLYIFLFIAPNGFPRVFPESEFTMMFPPFIALSNFSGDYYIYIYVLGSKHGIFMGILAHKHHKHKP